MISQLKLTVLATAALGVGVLLAAPGLAAAPEGDAPIFVRTGSAFAKWQDRVTAELDSALRDRAPVRDTDEDAIVQIAFTLDEKGKPTNLQFYNDEGDRTTRNNAMSAVRSLDSLAEVPVPNRDNVSFLANIIFSTDARQHKKLTARLEQMENTRLASKRVDRTFLALGR